MDGPSVLAKPAMLAWYRSRKYGASSPRFGEMIVSPTVKAVEQPPPAEPALREPARV
jgi:hypothetical protein